MGRLKGDILVFVNGRGQRFDHVPRERGEPAGPAQRMACLDVFAQTFGAPRHRRQPLNDRCSFWRDRVFDVPPRPLHRPTGRRGRCWWRWRSPGHTLRAPVSYGAIREFSAGCGAYGVVGPPLPHGATLKGRWRFNAPVRARGVANRCVADVQAQVRLALVNTAMYGQRPARPAIGQHRFTDGGVAADGERQGRRPAFHHFAYRQPRGWCARVCCGAGRHRVQDAPAKAGDAVVYNAKLHPKFALVAASVAAGQHFNQVAVHNAPVEFIGAPGFEPVCSPPTVARQRGGPLPAQHLPRTLVPFQCEPFPAFAHQHELLHLERILCHF